MAYENYVGKVECPRCGKKADRYRNSRADHTELVATICTCGYENEWVESVDLQED